MKEIMTMKWIFITDLDKCLLFVALVLSNAVNVNFRMDAELKYNMEDLCDDLGNGEFRSTSRRIDFIPRVI